MLHNAKENPKFYEIETINKYKQEIKGKDQTRGCSSLNELFAMAWLLKFFQKKKEKKRNH